MLVIECPDGKLYPVSVTNLFISGLGLAMITLIKLLIIVIPNKLITRDIFIFLSFIASTNIKSVIITMIGEVMLVITFTISVLFLLIILLLI